MIRIDSKTHRTLNERPLINHRDAWFRRLQNAFDQKSELSMKLPLVIDGIRGQSDQEDLIYTDPHQWVQSVLSDLANQAVRSLDTCAFVPLCLESDLYGVHFVDSLFGCEVYQRENQWYNRRLSSKIGTLKRPDLNQSQTWQIAMTVVDAFIQADVQLPLLGMPTVASALNVAVNLYGQNFLEALLLQPIEARHDLRVINDLLCWIHRWYQKKVPFLQLQPVISWNRTQPPGYGQICGCTSQLISPQTYRDLIFPLDEKLLAIHPRGGMIHLCGRHVHLIESFRELRSLKAIQINDRAAQDLPTYFQKLRKDQLVYLNPSETMDRQTAIHLKQNHRLILVGR